MKKNKLRIAIIVQRYGIVPPIYGGAVESLINTIIKKNEEKKLLEITLIESYDPKIRDIQKSFKETTFVFIKEHLIGKILYHLLKKIKNNLFFNGNFFSEYIFSAYKYLKKNKGKFDYIIIEEGMQVHGYKKFRNEFPGKTIYHSHLHEIPIYKVFHDYIISVSNFCRNEWKIKKNNENLFVLRNSVDVTKFQRRITSDERIEIRKSLGIKNSDFVVLFCGRMIPVKGIRELVKAIINIPQNDVKLLCVGSSGFDAGKETDYTKELHSLIKNHEDKVIFTGYINNDFLYKYYQSADMQVVPSLWEEAAGLVAIEGMLSGLPLIVTNSGGMIEYVSSNGTLIVQKDNINAMIDDLKTNIMRIKNDKNFIKKTKSCNPAYAKIFSEDKYYNDFIEILSTINKSYHKL